MRVRCFNGSFLMFCVAFFIAGCTDDVKYYYMQPSGRGQVQAPAGGYGGQSFYPPPPLPAPYYAPPAPSPGSVRHSNPYEFYQSYPAGARYDYDQYYVPPANYSPGEVLNGTL